MTNKLIKRLAKDHANYDLAVDIMTTGKNGEYGVRATLTLFKPADEHGKPGTTMRRTVGIGVATTIEEAKQSAIKDALVAAGIQ